MGRKLPGQCSVVAPAQQSRHRNRGTQLSPQGDQSALADSFTRTGSTGGGGYPKPNPSDATEGRIIGKGHRRPV